MTPSFPRLPQRGFTLIEIVVVLALLAILALATLPSMQDRIVREQVVEAVKLAELAKEAVATHWRAERELPEDNEAAGLPEAEKIVGNHVRAVEVEDGAIHVTFGNSANGAIQGGLLTLRPAVVADAPVVPIAWVCAGAPVPQGMAVRGRNRSTLENRHLPVNCRTLTPAG